MQLSEEIIKATIIKTKSFNSSWLLLTLPIGTVPPCSITIAKYFNQLVQVKFTTVYHFDRHIRNTWVNKEVVWFNVDRSVDHGITWGWLFPLEINAELRTATEHWRGVDSCQGVSRISRYSVPGLPIISNFRISSITLICVALVLDWAIISCQMFDIATITRIL